MPEIAFAISTAPGINPTESGGRLINAFPELAPPGSRSKFIWRRTPGLRLAENVGSGNHRGQLKLDTTLVAVNSDTAYPITKAAGVYTVGAAYTGTVGGTGRLIMARNMRSTPQIIAVDDDGTMTKIESGACSAFSDADLPVPNSVCFKDGYFFFGIGDGRCFATAINDVTVASTDWTRAESSPDSLVRVVPVPSGIALMGESGTEIWANTAEPTGFPFSRATVIPYGLKGKHAIAGFEEGFTGDLAFVANDNTVRLFSGYDTVPISNADLERLIETVEDPEDLVMGCYISGGRQVFTLSTPDWTWEYSPPRQTGDGAGPGHWRERISIGDVRWRIGFTVGAFNEWLAFDNEGTAFYKVDPTYKREGDEQLVWELRSVQAHGFPGRARINKASFDFKTGVGIDVGIDPIESHPVVQISWSIDGGVTFGNPIFRQLGTQGQIVPIDINQCGLTKRLGVQWKLRVADPVDVSFYGGAMDVEALAA